MAVAACRFAMLEAIFFLLCRFRRQRFGLFCACGFVAFWGVLGSGFVAFWCVLGSALGGVWLLRLAGLQCWSLFFSFFYGFRRQRFGLFCACERSVFGRFGTRFRWCSASSAPLPTRSLLCLFRVGCATVQGPAAAAFSLSLEGSKGDVSTPGGTLAI